MRRPEDLKNINKTKMTTHKKITNEETKWIGNELGVDWDIIEKEQFSKGLEVEMEHGKINPMTNVTNDDLLLTAKIAIAHLIEFPDYYTRLEKMENEAEQYWNIKKLIKSNKLVL